MDILDAIGNTCLVRPRKVDPPNCADIFVKTEWEYPTVSMKDRMAQAAISAEERDRRPLAIPQIHMELVIPDVSKLR